MSPSDEINDERPGDVKPASQQSAASDAEVIVLPGEHSPERALRPLTYRDLFEGLAARLPQVADFLRVFGRDAQWRLEDAIKRGDTFQERLTDEKVAHARTDERLRTRQMDSGAHSFLQVVGGACLGYGFAKLDSSAPLAGAAVVSLGLIMIAVGCWPVVTARRSSPAKDSSPSNDSSRAGDSSRG